MARGPQTITFLSKGKALWGGRRRENCFGRQEKQQDRGIDTGLKLMCMSVGGMMCVLFLLIYWIKHYFHKKRTKH